MKVTTIRTSHPGLRRLLAALAPLLLAGAAPAAQPTYPTSQAAADAFAAAVAKEDEGEALLEILGPEHREVLVAGDPAAWRQAMAGLHRVTGEAMTVTADGDDRAILVLGRAGWPMPVPLVKGEQGWRFDTEAGIEEINDRRIGRNELSAIDVAQFYPEAQLEYASQDRDGDEVLEYATRLISSPGKRDGLYWPTEAGADLSPFGPLIAEAADYAAYRKAGEPYRGYSFKILPRQGANPPGGKYDYVINGNMIAGYALVAWPADYGNSGIMTFLVNQQGIVYQKDLGPDSAKIAAGMKEYNPDSTWSPASP
jgi:hypothetical protein